MNRTFFRKILHLLCLTSLVFSSQISTNLWTWEFLGTPHDVKFLNEEEFMLSTTRGTIAKVKVGGEVEWKKNMVYQTQFEIANSGQYSLLVNQQSNYLDLINNKNSQLVWSINFSRDEGDFLRWDLLNEGKSFIGVLVTSRNIKIFNNERVIAEIEAQANEKYLDFVIDPFLKNLYIALIIDNQTVKINEISLTKFSSIVMNKFLTKELASPVIVKKAYLTIKFLFLALEDGSYIQINLSNNLPLPGKLPATSNFNLEYDLKKLNIADKMVLFSLKGQDNKIHVLHLQKNIFIPITLEKEKSDETYHWDVVENHKETFLYLIRKKNANTVIIYSVNLREDSYTLNQLYKYTINNEDFSIKSFHVNTKKTHTFMIITNEDKIYIFEKEKPAPVKLDQSLANVSFIELVGYYNDQGKTSDKINYHNNLENILSQKELTNIFANIYHMLVNDIADIFNRLKTNLLNLANKSATISIGSNLFKHYLILFTKGSQELYIINVKEGTILIKKHFKNKNIVKIIKNTEEDFNMGENIFIYIVMKDQVNSTFLILKFNLETTEIEEDSSLLDDLLFEEEIKTQYQNLIKNPSDSPISLTGKLQKSVIDKYNDKYLTEFENNSIYGIKFKKSNGKFYLSLAWNFLLNSGYTIVDTKSPNIHSNLSVTYHVMGKVFYKYIDGNIVLVLSQMENKTLLVTLVKANTGKVLHQSYISNVDFTQKIISIFEENLIVISYVKKEKGFSRSEIYTIEMMKREIEHSFVQMIEKNLKGEGEKEDVENVYENDLVFLTQTYALTRRIKNLFISKSKMNISNKYLLFLLENNQVFLLDKRGVSPRRPLMREEKGKSAPPVFDPLNSPYVDPEMTPYNPIINFDYKSTLNMNFLKDQIDNILISPTQYESTFILCTEGLNLSCYSVYPDKTFDTLTTSFAYPLIATFVIGIMTLAYLLRRYVKKNEFRQTFLNTN